MLARPPTLLLALALIGLHADAQVLVLTSGGDRIADRQPDDAGSNCGGWAYGPSPLLDDDGTVGGMYTVSDALMNHCSGAGLDAPKRFGDAIRFHRREAGGSFSAGVDVLSRASFSWMQDGDFLQAHPESFIGHLASPSVVRRDGRLYMAFVGSVDDRNLCAGEHYAGNNCGSCFEPWSHFEVMWAVSDDGVNWRVRERGAGDAMLIGRAPEGADTMGLSQYKGLARVSLLARDDGYFYLAAQYWGREQIKILMFRIAYDPAATWGTGGEAELWSWNRQQWMSCENGRLPDFIGQPGEYSLPSFANPLGSIVRTKVFGSERFLALGSETEPSLSDGHGIVNRISYQTSTNLLDWTPEESLRSALPFFADGNGYDVSVIDPVSVDAPDGTLHLFFASADGDARAGVTRDGRHDCELDVTMPTAPYVGTGIYEAVVKPQALQPVVITLRADEERLLIGGSAHYTIRVTAADGSQPSGMVDLIDRGRAVVTVPLRAGLAHAELWPTATGEHHVYAYFPPQGNLDAGRTAVMRQTVEPLPRRRALR
jgi:hypothetical protein